MPIVLTDNDLQRLSTLNGDDLSRVYQCVIDRLRAVQRLDDPNQNVVTVRLPLVTCDVLKRLALKHGVTRSRIVRDAVVEFTRRHPA